MYFEGTFAFSDFVAIFVLLEFMGIFLVEADVDISNGQRIDVLFLLNLAFFFNFSLI